MMEIKRRLHDYCLNYVCQRIERIKSEIASVQHSANEETKSSAGDKHETARAMAQLEVELNSKQLIEAEKLLAALHQIDITREFITVGAGALVRTSSGDFFISISIGKINLDGNDYYVVSPDSPVGKVLMGKRGGDSFLWNNKTTVILSIH